MMPSRRQQSWKACNASRSVTVTYSARPLSLSHACSGPTPGMAEPRRYRVGVKDLSVVALKQVGSISVQHPRPAGGEGGRVLPGFKPEPRSFHTDQAHLGTLEVRVEDPRS